MLMPIEETPENDPHVVTWGPSTLYSHYYHGPFRNMKREVDALIHFVESQEHRKPAKIYSWVTNCPRCWKEHGGPTTILLARMPSN